MNTQYILFIYFCISLYTHMFLPMSIAEFVVFYVATYNILDLICFQIHGCQINKPRKGWRYYFLNSYLYSEQSFCSVPP